MGCDKPSFLAPVTDSAPEKTREHRYRQALHFSEKNLLSEEYGFSYLPGLSNLILAPFAIYCDVIKSHASNKVGDCETINDFKLRLAQNLSAFSSAACTTLNYINALFNNSFHPIVQAVARNGSIFGLLLCFLEGILEIVGLDRQLHFHYSATMRFARFLEKQSKTIDKQPYLFFQEIRKKLPQLFLDNPLAAKEKDKIEKRLTQALSMQSSLPHKDYVKELHLLSSALLAKSFAKMHFDGKNVGKVVALQRRVGTWAAKDLDKHLNSLSKAILSKNPRRMQKGGQEVTRIFRTLDEQSLKKIGIHIVGLCAVAATTIAIVLTVGTGVGAVAIGALLMSGMLFSIVRYLALNGLFTQNGWKFSAVNCLPAFLLRRINLQRDQQLAKARAHGIGSIF